MADPKFKPQFRRLLFIDGEIRAGRLPNCTTLARKWEVSARTIQRDLDYLKWELGAPLEYDAVRHGFLYTDRSWFLPSVVISEGELLALLIGTQAAAMYEGTPLAARLRAVYRRLAPMLPSRISLPPELVSDRVSFVGAPARRIDPEVWKAVLRGLIGGHELEASYRSAHDPAPRERALRPYHLLSLEGEWYVVGADPAAEGVRQFALSRFRAARVTERRFEIPAGFDVRRMLRERFGKSLHGDDRPPVTVRLRFAPDATDFVAEKQWHPQQRFERGPDGAGVLEFPVRAVRDVVPWILSFGPAVTVLAPDELRDRVRDLVARAAAAYERQAAEILYRYPPVPTRGDSLPSTRINACMAMAFETEEAEPFVPPADGWPSVVLPRPWAPAVALPRRARARRLESTGRFGDSRAP